MQFLVFGVLVLIAVGLLYLLVTVYLAFFGSNYIKTPDKHIALALSVLKRGDTFIDLGFGNGEVLEAALNKGVKLAIGYDIDFLRYLYTVSKLWRYIIRGSLRLYLLPLWNADVSQADVVYTFFTSYHIDRLYTKLTKEMKPKSWFVSYVHAPQGIRPDRKDHRVYMYRIGRTS